MEKSPLDYLINESIKMGNEIENWIKKIGDSFTSNDDDNSITLYNFVESYMKLYSDFKEEYESLEKLNIGEYNNVIEYIDNDNFRLLSLQLNEQEKDSIVPAEIYNRLIIQENYNSKNGILAYFSTGSSKCNRVVPVTNVSSSILTGYLDLFGKYRQLFDFYRDIRLGGCFLPNQSVTFRIDANNDSLINGLESIEVYIESKYVFDIKRYMLINTNYPSWSIGSSMIDYYKCRTKFGDENFSDLFLHEEYENALKTIKINRAFLRNYNLDCDNENIKK